MDAKALSVNVTVVTPAAQGYLTLFPGNRALPLSSTINFVAGQVRANNAVLQLSSDGNGTLNVFNGSSGATNFVLDVNAFFR
jgi:hypothetical protein